MAATAPIDRSHLAQLHARRRAVRARIVAAVAAAALAWCAHAAHGMVALDQSAAAERMPLGAAAAPPAGSGGAGFEVVRTFTSTDGGNVTAVLKKADLPVEPRTNLAGNAERIRTILENHTPLRHCLSSAPFLRPIRKLRQRLSESVGLWGARTPKALMERALQQAFRSGIFSIALDLGEWALAAI